MKSPIQIRLFKGSDRLCKIVELRSFQKHCILSSTTLHSRLLPLKGCLSWELRVGRNMIVLNDFYNIWYAQACKFLSINRTRRKPTSRKSGHFFSFWLFDSYFDDNKRQCEMQKDKFWILLSLYSLYCFWIFFKSIFWFVFRRSFLCYCNSYNVET